MLYVVYCYYVVTTDDDVLPSLCVIGAFNQTLPDAPCRSLAGKLQPLFAVKGRDDPRDLQGA